MSAGWVGGTAGPGLRGTVVVRRPASRFVSVRERTHVPSVGFTRRSVRAAPPVLVSIGAVCGAGSAVPRPGTSSQADRRLRLGGGVPWPGLPGPRGVRPSPAARVGGTRRVGRSACAAALLASSHRFTRSRHAAPPACRARGSGGSQSGRSRRAALGLPNQALQLTSAVRGVPRQRRPLLASLAGRLVPSGGGAAWATLPGQRRSQLSADPLGGGKCKTT
jgi:hypothetical protein